jgi:hypothetical protein
MEVIEKIIKLKALVPSESQEGAFYIVDYDGTDWTCTCPDHKNRHRDCKHIEEAKGELR